MKEIILALTALANVDLYLEQAVSDMGRRGIVPPVMLIWVHAADDVTVHSRYAYMEACQLAMEQDWSLQGAMVECVPADYKERPK